MPLYIFTMTDTNTNTTLQTIAEAAAKLAEMENEIMRTEDQKDALEEEGRSTDDREMRQINRKITTLKRQRDRQQEDYDDARALLKEVQKSLHQRQETEDSGLLVLNSEKKKKIVYPANMPTYRQEGQGNTMTDPRLFIEQFENKLIGAYCKNPLAVIPT